MSAIVVGGYGNLARPPSLIARPPSPVVITLWLILLLRDLAVDKARDFADFVSIHSPTLNCKTLNFCLGLGGWLFDRGVINCKTLDFCNGLGGWLLEALNDAVGRSNILWSDSRGFESVLVQTTFSNRRCNRNEPIINPKLGVIYREFCVDTKEPVRF